MKHRLIPYFIATFLAVTLLPPVAVQAAPYAAVVMDARNGKIYHSRNADTRLHPASIRPGCLESGGVVSTHGFAVVNGIELVRRFDCLSVTLEASAGDAEEFGHGLI